jgi:multiple sugar transport system permease protein
MSFKKISKILLYAFFITIALLWLLPIGSSILLSFKTINDYMNQTFWQLPTKFNFVTNIEYAWNSANIGTFILNSIVYATVGAIVAIIIASLAAFSIVRLKLKGRNSLFGLIFIGTMFPFQMFLIPLYIMYLSTGLYNTKIGLILFYIAICIPFATFVFRGFFISVPKELHEAAKLDGCSDLGVYAKIFMPMSLPAISVVFLFQFTWVWNDLLFGMTLSTSNSVRPVMVGLAQLSGENLTNVPGLIAGAWIASLPTIIVFILLRRYFSQGLVLHVAG